MTFGTTDHRPEKAEEHNQDDIESISSSDEKHHALKHPIAELKDKLDNHHLRAELSHFKHKVGKLSNIFNPNHRHDEEHEQETDHKRTELCESHRFRSFAPAREGNNVKWYVDGRDYFWALSDALERAKETIFIQDWWLSPELFLRRPPHQNRQWRLDRLLKRKAEAGVKIYIIIYKEVEQALTCNSEHTKKVLNNLCRPGEPGHGNIRVMRHPDHTFLENGADGHFYFSHHQKQCIIDRKVVYVGGLDLCYGRWDMRQHPMADLHPHGIEGELWPGQDFNNVRIKDFDKVQDWKQNAVSKAEYGRMPWHDVHMGLMGPCVYDLVEHFVLRWNFIKRDKYKRDKRFDWLLLEGRGEDIIGVQRPKYPVGKYIKYDVPEEKDEGSCQTQVLRSAADWSTGVLTEHSVQNAYKELITQAEHYVYIENQFFITATGDEQEPIRNTIGAAIVEAVVRAAREDRKFRVIIVIPSVPGFAGDLRQDAANGTRAIMDYQYKSLNRGPKSIFGQIHEAGVDPKKYIFVFNLRTFDRLHSTDEMVKREEETGIHYQDVERAHAAEVLGEDGASNHKHFGRSDSKKKIMQPKKDFEAKEGKIPDAEGVSKDVKDSVAGTNMLHQKKLVDEKWEEGQMERDNYVQEELYIHAKLLIVDDTHVICGSANINDRSMCGDRDSELALHVQDSRKIQSKMDGDDFEASYFATTLRRFLWREHLGLLDPTETDASKDPNAAPIDSAPNDPVEDEFYERMADPLSDDLWEEWTSQATRNTEIYRDMFHADPDDSILSFDDYDKFLKEKSGDDRKHGHLFDHKQMSDEQVKERLGEIRGHLVWMPLEFLRDAEMAERGLDLNFVTDSLYT